MTKDSKPTPSQMSQSQAECINILQCFISLSLSLSHSLSLNSLTLIGALSHNTAHTHVPGFQGPSGRETAPILPISTGLPFPPSNIAAEPNAGLSWLLSPPAAPKLGFPKGKVPSSAAAGRALHVQHLLNATSQQNAGGLQPITTRAACPQ